MNIKNEMGWKAMTAMVRMKTDLDSIAPALAKMSEMQQAEMIGWLQGYIAGAEAQKSETPPEKAS